MGNTDLYIAINEVIECLLLENMHKPSLTFRRIKKLADVFERYKVVNIDIMDKFIAFEILLSKYLGMCDSLKFAYELKVDYQFEPHGKASETYEKVYTLTIKNIGSYWKGINGWNKRDEKFTDMVFNGRTLESVLDRAIDFLIDMNKDIEYRRGY